MRSPALPSIVAVYAYGLLAFLVVLVALAMPGGGVTFASSSVGVTAFANGRAVATLPAGTAITVAGGGDALRLPAGELVADYSPRGSFGEVRAWFDTRSRLARIVAAPGARVGLPQSRTTPLASRPRRLADLPVDTWLLLAQGALLTLLGSWLAAMRPRDPAARMFALSCAGMAATSLSGAVYDARELAANGLLLHACQTVNFAGSYFGASALAAIFAVQPTPLLRMRAALAGVAAATVWGAACGVGLLPLQAFYLGLLLLLLAFPALLTVQVRRTRGDPATRASLRWIGVTTMAGAGYVTVGMSAPKLLGLPDLGGDGSTIVPLALVYGGIAFGIGRHRLFELDRWTYRVVLGGAAVLGLLLLDGLLIALFDLERPLALLMALGVAGYLYLPLRALVWRRVMGVEGLDDGEKFQLATGVAYAPSAGARREGWRRLLGRLFAPLTIEPHEPVAQVTLLDGGAALIVPAIADSGPLRLAFRAGGTRLFGRDQVRLAEEMLALMRRADATRAEYARGVGEERQRIARDLHDDVCAMLLTSLHRDNVAEVRGDVRNAMADIRTMIGELTGERVTLDRALAGLRFETSERLAAAGVALSWPLPAAPYPAAVLDYSASRALVSAVREAISNTLKHARARTVSVAVTAGASTLTVRLGDDGVGGAQPGGGAGRGLANMAARMAAVGGSFLIETGAGTTVILSMPLSPAAEAPSEPLESGMGAARRLG